MLKGINPLLGPDLLQILRAMGHGDEIAVVDAHFPAQANARRLVRLDGIDAVTTVGAIVSVLPLDDFVPVAAYRMAVIDDPTAIAPITADFVKVLAAAGYHAPIGALERFAYYERTRSAAAIVATGETRLYGNLILTKGIVRS